MRRVTALAVPDNWYLLKFYSVNEVKVHIAKCLRSKLRF